MSGARKPKFRPYFLVGRKWKHLDSPLFYRRETAANYAGNFYIVLRWKVMREIGPSAAGKRRGEERDERET